MEDNEVPSSDPIVHFEYADGTESVGPINWKECSDEELIHFYETLGADGARLEHRERTGADLKIDLFSPIEDQKKAYDWFCDWADRNPEKYKELYSEDN
jgi:hypothetical protein